MTLNSQRLFSAASIVLATLLLSGCPKGGKEFKKGQEAELRKDYDTALIQYQRALEANPGNVLYELKAKRMRFEAAQMHVDNGHKLLDQGLLEPAAAEFEKALAIDPSSFVAEQELRRTLQLIVADRQAADQAAQPAELSVPIQAMPEHPPELRPLSRERINLQMNEDGQKIYETIGKLAGINVVFDPDFQARRVPVQLSNATLEEALDIVALMTKTFWKVVTPNTIMVIQDTKPKRTAYEEQIIKTFYLSNITQPTELNELVTMLRQLLDLQRIQPSTQQKAIIIRDTPDKVAVAEKLIHDIDRAKPEVMVQVAVLQARRDRARDLGILPSTSVPLLFTPRTDISVGEEISAVPLNELDRLSSGDYSLVLPSATAMALLTDSATRVIQNPQLRVTDGQKATLRIGDKVPFAVGSFQPGIGGVGVNPLVNTQFNFQDVGVNLDITPQVHSNREISLNVKVEVSSVTSRVNIGGIEQPVFGQRTIEHDIRLREGEVSILGGIIERSETESLEGWPGLSQVPFLRYLFSNTSKDSQENEVLLVLTPRLVRVPELTAANLRSLPVGTQENFALPRVRGEARSEPQPSQPSPVPATPPAEPESPGAEPLPSPSPLAQLGFDPAQASATVGQQLAVNLVVKDVQDLFAVPFAVRYDPQVLELLEVHHGGFLGGAAGPAALVQRIEKETGTAYIALRQPPGAEGVSGEGVLVTLVFKAVAAGQSGVTVPQVAARSADGRALNLTVAAAQVTVK